MSTRGVGAGPRVVALSGGIGGAKLVTGLCAVMDPRELLVVANPGDDFEHLGLVVTPDIDTLIYTAIGMHSRERGWGREGETWSFMTMLERLGGETWFALGDGDLALHVERTRRLRAGEGLAAITEDFCRRLGVAFRLLPATDDPVRTRVATTEGELAFQDYFVARRCAPRITGIAFAGAETARPHPAVIEALADPGLEAVVLCPSNPFISIDPILAVPGLAAAVRACAAPVVAVSPVVAGAAVKGPTGKMFDELGLGCSVVSVARHYAGLLDGLVVDRADEALAGEVRALGPEVALADTLMSSAERKAAVAREVLGLAARCRGGPAA